MNPWPIRRLLQIDKWADVRALGAQSKETISSRGGRAVLRVFVESNAQPGDLKWCLLCAILNWFQKDHCVRSIDYHPPQTPKQRTP